MNARERILAALRAGRPDVAPPLPAPAPRATLPVGERAAAFVAALARVGGTAELVADAPAACRRVAALLVAAGARRVACSDAVELAPLAAAVAAATADTSNPVTATAASSSAAAVPVAAGAAIRLLAPDAPRDELLAADAGVTSAQWGIAESGTVVLTSAAERSRLASLLPARHFVLLPVARLLGTLGEAFAALHAPGAAPAARTITFVTGPSRTADIELTLVVGVHGPAHLHVLLIDR